MSKLFLLFMDNTASDDVGGRIYEFNLSKPFYQALINEFILNTANKNFDFYNFIL